MGRFLFATMPGAGHVNPMLPVAAELVRRGDEVEVWTSASFATAVRDTGALLHLMPEPIFPPNGQRIGPRQALAGIRDMLRPPADLLAAAAAAGPGTVVVHDALRGSWGRKIGLPAVAFASSTVRNGYLSTADLAGLLARRDPARTARIRERLLRTRVPRLLARLPIPMTLRAPLTIVTVPRMFQPSGEEFGPECVFVGPCLEPRAGDTDHPILARIAADDRPLVLVALGTAMNNRPEFYRTCFSAFEHMPWQVVLAVGQHTDVGTLGTPPPNVLVADHVPQLEILARAAVFVSHAGMNSTMESLHAGVPMVLLPDIAAAVHRLQAAVHGSGGQAEAADALQKFAASHH